MLKFKTELIGLKEVNKTLESVLKFLQGSYEMRQALQEAEIVAMKSILQNMKAEGRTYSEAYTPLNPSYAIRKFRRWGSKPILEASGHMKSNFKSIFEPRRLTIYNPTEYFGTHQKGYPQKNIPRRRMFVMHQSLVSRVIEIFKKNLKQSFNG